jgi:hypothetical protein
MKKITLSLFSSILFFISTASHAAYYLYINNLQAPTLTANYITTWPYLKSSIDSKSSNVNIIPVPYSYYQFQMSSYTLFSSSNSNPWNATLRVSDPGNANYCLIQVSGSYDGGWTYKIKVTPSSYLVQCSYNVISKYMGELDIYAI